MTVKGVVLVSAEPQRLEQVLEALPPDHEVRPAMDLKELTDVLLWDDSEIVVLDVDHPRIDPLEAVRLVRGTRWDVRMLCIGQGAGVERAQRAGAEVLGDAAWDDLPRLLQDQPQVP